jgi:hypothetical protein
MGDKSVPRHAFSEGLWHPTPLATSGGKIHSERARLFESLVLLFMIVTEHEKYSVLT